MRSSGPWPETEINTMSGDEAKAKSTKLGLHYSKNSREAAIVRQVGSAASRSSLLLVHLVSTVTGI